MVLMTTCKTGISVFEKRWKLQLDFRAKKLERMTPFKNNYYLL